MRWSALWPSAPPLIQMYKSLHATGTANFGDRGVTDNFSYWASSQLTADMAAHIDFADDVTGFLADHDLTIDDIGSWVSHPGGPKVLEAINTALCLDDDALELSWRSLSEVGNLSSASVLHVLRDARDKPPPTGTPGVLMAMGPGFCAELVLLRWN